MYESQTQDGEWAGMNTERNPDRSRADAGRGRAVTGGAAGERREPVRPGAGLGRPDFGQWQGDPDDLWPTFGADPARMSRPDRRDRQRHEQAHNQARRRPDRIRSRLTREEIVDAAIAIADDEGAEALSMRRIAQVLRSGTMSLYWHVANKEHLLDLMRDMLMAEITVPEPSGDLRADLRSIAVSNRAMLRRHTWLMDFVGGRPPLGPNTLLALERSLVAVADLNLAPALAFDILAAVNTYVSGAVLREVQEIRARAAEQQSGLDPDAVMSERQAWRDRLGATGIFGNFVRFLDADIDPDAPETMDERFEFGLDCLLDGIAARIARR
jgi:AcrR family transcriptional regulator